MPAGYGGTFWYHPHRHHHLARQLWRGLRRQEIDGGGQVDQALERVLTVYDTIAVDRAQTVLRYWNWSLTSALTPADRKSVV